MQTTEYLKLEELEELATASTNETKISRLIENNLNIIKQQQNITFIVPITVQIVLLLFLGYKYKIPVVKGAALYQLYANDLIVILVSILDSFQSIEELTNECTQICNKLKGNQDITLTGIQKEFYDTIVQCKFEDKLYIPPKLW